MPPGRVTVGQRLVRDPARRGRDDARAGRRDRLLLAVVLDLPAPGRDDRRARAITVPLDARRPPRPRRDGPRGHRRHAHPDRLQPEQPQRHRAAARGDRRVRGRPAAPRGRDPRRGLRRVLHAPGPGRVARPARPAPEPRAAAHVLEGLRPLRAAGGLRARLGGLPARARPRAPAVLGERARPGGRRGGARATRTRWSGAWSAPRSSACTWRRAWPSAGSRPRTARPTSRGSPWATATRARSSAAWRSGASSCARARRSAQEGRLRVTYGTRAENDRFLAALDELL